MSHGASLYIRKQEIEKMIREKKDLLMEAGAELSVFNSHADMGLELYEREKKETDLKSPCKLWTVPE
jgi:hypothetical protein